MQCMHITWCFFNLSLSLYIYMCIHCYITRTWSELKTWRSVCKRVVGRIPHRPKKWVKSTSSTGVPGFWATVILGLSFFSSHVEAYAIFTNHIKPQLIFFWDRFGGFPWTILALPWSWTLPQEFARLFRRLRLSCWSAGLSLDGDTWFAECVYVYFHFLFQGDR